MVDGKNKIFFTLKNVKNKCDLIIKIKNEINY